ncbi:MAG: SpoVR family protein [Chloroflexi bacterium AL-W]|nr:SpoVR family protein [Chloroflexi bacterium AL-N1]NOK67018.1 SpoVR family protein [Chloroflexi bacterium AL-N10]NOK74690.1 SpoVR family protein [Chloroflexi bacterium AL-N5]NOK81620.1 SpoVR family protein [Chloroflexi bacterium AL-W]NOK89090.1 SpoVR family protein [Chloroflexi bacterium AL-N15]
MKSTRLPPELQAAWDEIEGHATEYGLDFFPISYEVLDYRTLYETAALGGFPTRYPHWRFGMDYDQLIKGHVWLGSTIYEMVINTNPSYAYLLEGNDLVTQKMVMAHVTGHVDFFKHNMWFAHTNRKMLDEMANHAARIQRVIDRYGYDIVEDFIDTCLSLENLIDYHAPYIRRPEAQTAQPVVSDYDEPPVFEGFKVERDYMKDYINPPEFLAEQRKLLEEEASQTRRFPENPQKDILLFLMNYAPLERWQHTVLDVIRNEAYYFAPQGMTKILNEGWASYWHSEIMTKRALRDDEVIDFAERHSGVVAISPGRLNPYKLGIELLRDIEYRWDTGRFGKEYDECDDIREKKNWDRQLGLGRQKLFEIRKLYNDVTFIDAFLTPEFCLEQQLFTFRYNRDTDFYEIASREFEEVKQKLLFRLTNFGQPSIYVQDGNYNNRGEMYLSHRHEGIDLKMDYARETMRNIHKIWTRPIHLETIVDEKRRLISYDGSDFSERRID